MGVRRGHTAGAAAVQVRQSPRRLERLGPDADGTDSSDLPPGGLGLRCRVGQFLRRRLLAVGWRVAERAVPADIFAAVAALPVVSGGEDPRAALDVVVNALDGPCIRGDHWLPRSAGIRSANQNLSRSTQPQIAPNAWYGDE